MNFTMVRSAALGGLLALVVTPGLAAQGSPRYRLLDLGTLGGPTSYESSSGFGNLILNNAGIVSSASDISSPDLSCSFNPDCFFAHAFLWQMGLFTDLGALPGGNNSAVGSLNASGWIAGLSQIDQIDSLTGVTVTHATLWKNDRVIDLGTLGGAWSTGVYVNNAGQVIGFSTINSIPDPFSFQGAAQHPFIWQDGVMRDLGTLGGPDALPGAGCANQRSGFVVGLSLTALEPATGLPASADPFLWENSTMLDLGTLGGTFGFAQCANNGGQVIGQSNLSGDLVSHPFLWQQGVLTDLGTLGGDNGMPWWLNDSGEVVGEADFPGNVVHHAFLWRTGVMSDLGSLGTDSAAFAINSNHQVVGRSRIDDATVHAFLWQPDTGMVDLNTVMPAGSSLELVDAVNINDRGEIVGLGSPPGVPRDPEAIGTHLFLLIPCDSSSYHDCSPVSTAVPSKVRVPSSQLAFSVQGRRVPAHQFSKWRTRWTEGLSPK